MNIADLYQSVLGYSDPVGQAWAQSAFGDTLDNTELASFMQTAVQNGTPITYNNPSSIYSGAGTVPGMSLTNLYNTAGIAPDRAGYDFWNQRFGSTLEQHEIDAFNKSAQSNLAMQNQFKPPVQPLQPLQPVQQQAQQENLGQLFPRTNWGNYQTSQRGGRYFDSTSGKYQGLGNLPQTQTASL
jgi:hypothetical protein